MMNEEFCHADIKNYISAICLLKKNEYFFRNIVVFGLFSLFLQVK